MTFVCFQLHDTHELRAAKPPCSLVELLREIALKPFLHCLCHSLDLTTLSVWCKIVAEAFVNGAIQTLGYPKSSYNVRQPLTVFDAYVLPFGDARLFGDFLLRLFCRHSDCL